MFWLNRLLVRPQQSSIICQYIPAISQLPVTNSVWHKFNIHTTHFCKREGILQVIHWYFNMKIRIHEVLFLLSNFIHNLISLLNN